MFLTKHIEIRFRFKRNHKAEGFHYHCIDTMVMYDLVEQQRKLQENRNPGQQQQSQQPVQMRTAKLDDAAKLLSKGYQPDQIACYINLPESIIRAEIARLESREREKRWLMSLSIRGNQ